MGEPARRITQSDSESPDLEVKFCAVLPDDWDSKDSGLGWKFALNYAAAHRDELYPDFPVKIVKKFVHQSENDTAKGLQTWHEYVKWGCQIAYVHYRQNPKLFLPVIARLEDQGLIVLYWSRHRFFARPVDPEGLFSMAMRPEQWQGSRHWTRAWNGNYDGAWYIQRLIQIRDAYHAESLCMLVDRSWPGGASLAERARDRWGTKTVKLEFDPQNRQKTWQERFSTSNGQKCMNADFLFVYAHHDWDTNNALPSFLCSSSKVYKMVFYWTMGDQAHANIQPNRYLQAYYWSSAAWHPSLVQENGQFMFRTNAEFVREYSTWWAAHSNTSDEFANAEKGVNNLGASCFHHCKQTGKCDWCGLGYCCQKGRVGYGCDGYMGAHNRHVCVPLEASHLPSIFSALTAHLVVIALSAISRSRSVDTDKINNMIGNSTSLDKEVKYFHTFFGPVQWDCNNLFGREGTLVQLLPALDQRTLVLKSVVTDGDHMSGQFRNSQHCIFPAPEYSRRGPGFDQCLHKASQEGLQILIWTIAISLGLGGFVFYCLRRRGSCGGKKEWISNAAPQPKPKDLQLDAVLVEMSNIKIDARDVEADRRDSMRVSRPFDRLPSFSVVEDDHPAWENVTTRPIEKIRYTASDSDSNHSDSDSG